MFIEEGVLNKKGVVNEKTALSEKCIETYTCKIYKYKNTKNPNYKKKKQKLQVLNYGIYRYNKIQEKSKLPTNRKHFGILVFL